MLTPMERAIAENRPATQFHRGDGSAYDKLVNDARGRAEQLERGNSFLAVAHDLAVEREISREPRCNLNDTRASDGRA